MTASSVTGVGQGSADKKSPPGIKLDRLVGQPDPRIVMSGVGKLVAGEVTIHHPAISDFDRTVIIATSVTSRAVRVTARNNELFIVNGTEEDDFWWIMVTLGVSVNLIT